MFWSVGPFWYMVYGIWYVVYGMKMAFTMNSHMFRVRRAWAAYNVVHLFLVKVISKDRPRLIYIGLKSSTWEYHKTSDITTPKLKVN